jgi:hypothetical protein
MSRYDDLRRMREARFATKADARKLAEAVKPKAEKAELRAQAWRLFYPHSTSIKPNHSDVGVIYDPSPGKWNVLRAG